MAITEIREDLQSKDETAEELLERANPNFLGKTVLNNR